MDVFFQPSFPRGVLPAPPSKSYAHRYLLGAALADGESTIGHFSPGEDLLATLDCIRALGSSAVINQTTLRVTGHPGGSPHGIDPPVLPCRESGSTLRFLLPVALSRKCAGFKEETPCAVLFGSERLLARGIGIYEEILPEKGARIRVSEDRITLSGHLRPGEYVLRGNVSSQFVTGLLYALPLLPSDSTLRILPPVESAPYLAITRAVLGEFGIAANEIGEYYYQIPGNQTYRPVNVTVEGDWSNAAFLYALNTLGGEVTVTGLNPHSLQGDRVCLPCFDALRGKNAVLDVSACPDLAPVLFAVAAAKHGATFTGTARLRLKESDRAETMARELRKFGTRMTIGENSVDVIPEAFHAPDAPLCGHNDHRIVMALSVLLAFVGGKLEGAEAVKKSYPGFFRDLRQIGVNIQEEKEVLDET